MANAKRYTPNQSAAGSAGLRGLLLYLLPLPLLPAALSALVSGQVKSALIAGGTFAAYMVSASIARQGIRLERDYRKRSLARAPRTPYKTVAGILTGITTGVLAWLGADYTLIASLLLGAAALLGFALSYGLDPRQDKIGNIALGVSIDDVINALEAAEIRIKAIDQAKLGIRNTEYTKQIDRITQKARAILDTIEEDPTRLANARKFLKVYLDGAKKVTEGYARTQKAPQGAPVVLDTDFSRVLNSIEQTFDEQHTKLLENNNFDLDVQITVLEQQLKREQV